MVTITVALNTGVKEIQNEEKLYKVEMKGGNKGRLEIRPR